MARTAKVSVVIRALNEEAHIGRLLHGLGAQTRPPDELILVDSGSTDQTVEIAKSRGCKVVNIAKHEFTFGRALNRGCEAATGDLLLIVSAHVYPVYNDYLERLMKPFENSDIAIAYGRQVGDHRTKYSESRVMIKWFPKESIWDQGHPFSNNANALVRRSIWEKLRYREELTGLEDLDFAKRAIEVGARIAYVAEAPVVHVHEESWKVLQNRYRREAIAYKDIYPDTTFSALQAVTLALSNIVSDCWHALRDRKLRENVWDIARFRFAQFRGAYLGFADDGAPDAELLRRFYYPAQWVTRPQLHAPSGEIDYSMIESAGHYS
ncbi:glycosyltransferase family 2 protein [Mycolicibacterium parafortuitum]|uniref:glycosyltransferase family 2 protein n=1 Tax=Mycolicibacterium parafortuitum TaxID=39692 RepID=UPI002351F5DD|nr:glycosyltransferase [Mycolicibacterium parafortuitum]